jgi:hypothetical protein
MLRRRLSWRRPREATLNPRLQREQLDKVDAEPYAGQQKKFGELRRERPKPVL